MTDQTTIALMSAMTREACAGEPDLEQRCRKAFAANAKPHWMQARDDQQAKEERFKAALAAVLTDPLTTTEEYQRVVNTTKQLANLNSLLRGQPMDLDRMLAEQEENPPLPLSKWWHEELEKVDAEPVK